MSRKRDRAEEAYQWAIHRRRSIADDLARHASVALRTPEDPKKFNTIEAQRLAGAFDQLEFIVDPDDY